MWLRIAPTEVEQNRKETGDGPSVPTYGAVQLERASSLIPEKPNNPSFWPLKCILHVGKKSEIQVASTRTRNTSRCMPTCLINELGRR